MSMPVIAVPASAFIRSAIAAWGYAGRRSETTLTRATSVASKTPAKAPFLEQFHHAGRCQFHLFDSGQLLVRHSPLNLVEHGVQLCLGGGAATL